MNQRTKTIRLIQIRLSVIHLQLEWIATREAAAAWIGGYGANGELDPLRQKLIDKSDRLLNRLEALTFRFG